MSRQVQIISCDKCALLYVVTGIPHVCAGWATRSEKESQIASTASSSGWCNDCHGYTHMPWCGEYVESEQSSGSKRYLLSEIEHLIGDNERLSGSVKSLGERLEAQAETLAKVVGERERLREELQLILKEAEYVADAKAPFSTWVATHCRVALGDQKGGEG